MNYYIKNIRIIDPLNNREEYGDIIITDGKFTDEKIKIYIKKGDKWDTK